jgi:hypothetical protein
MRPPTRMKSRRHPKSEEVGLNFKLVPGREQVANTVAGGAYRNGPTNDHRTNNALLAYTEYRAGAGINYTPKNGVSLQFTAGWTFERRIDYFRAGPDNTAKGAPYLKLDLSIAL